VGFDRRTARVKGKLALLVPCAERDGLLYVHAMVTRKPGELGYIPDADVPKQEWSGRTHAAVILASGAMAAERAKTAAQGGTKVLGIVMMQPQIAGKADWEQFAADESQRKVLDAVPTEVVQCPPGPERVVPEQLGFGLREEGAK
jgi:hypothetical protein